MHAHLFCCSFMDHVACMFGRCRHATVPHHVTSRHTADVQAASDLQVIETSQRVVSEQHLEDHGGQRGTARCAGERGRLEDGCFQAADGHHVPGRHLLQQRQSQHTTVSQLTPPNKQFIQTHASLGHQRASFHRASTAMNAQQPCTAIEPAMYCNAAPVAA